MKKWVLMILGLLMMLVLAVPAMAQTGEPEAAQSAGAVSTSYTVEFTYDGNQYVMPGDSSVGLNAILDGIGLTGVAEVVEISDASLFSASNATGEWIVNTHRAFSSTEWMKVTIGGVVYKITVTDDRIETNVPYLDANGKTQTHECTVLRNKCDQLPGGWFATDQVMATGRVTVTGNVHLILQDKCSFEVNGGINVSEGSSLTIYAQSTGEDMGSLTINNVGSSQAGIGGGVGESGGTITINGGEVTATGGQYGAGIGGGQSGAGGTITINGGKVTAIGGQFGAGIGGGQFGAGGTITISSGKVTATGGKKSAGIGGGHSGAGGTITINGGEVTATGDDGAGIGGGQNKAGGSVTITGGAVTAKGGDNAAGIGPGKDYSGDEPGTLTMSLSNADDFIKANTYNNNSGKYAAVNVENGCYLKDGKGKFYSDSLSESDLNGLADMKLLMATQPYDITIEQGTNGTVSASYAQAEEGTPVTITVNPNKGYVLSGLTYKVGGGEPQAIMADVNGEYKFSMPAGNVTVTAEWVEHTHSFTYSASGAIITANCANTDGHCNLPPSTAGGSDHIATLTIAAEGGAYDGTTAFGATVTNNIPAVEGDTVGEVEYYKVNTGNATTGGTKQDSAPIDAGYYYVSVTLTSGSNSYTAVKAFTVAKADLGTPTVTMNGYTYGGTVSTPSIGTYSGGGAVTYYYNTTDNASGGTAWENITATTLNANTYYMYAVITESDNYNSYTTATASFTVSKADQTAPDAPTKASATINSITLTAITNGEYKMGEGNWQSSPTFSGLTMNTEYTFYQRIAGDANHNTSPASQPATISTNDHVHNWSYQASGAVITATCANNDGGHTGELTSTLTINAPTLTTYGETGKDANATITGSIDGVTNPDIVYKKDSETLDAAPTDAGTYRASITMGEGNDVATASVEYTIVRAAPTANAPTGLTATYGRTLNEVTLTNPEGNTSGTWTWVDAGTTSVGNAGTNTFKANFTPTDTANYNPVSDVDVTLTVGKADATDAMKAAAVSIEARNGKTATVSYMLPDNASYGDVSNSNTDFFTVSKDNGLVLTAAKEWTETEWAVSTVKTFTIPVTGATNYNDYTLTVSVTPTYHQHSFSYSVNGATITATCEDTSCDLHSSPATLTLSAANATYTGSAYTGASLSDTTAWTGAGLTAPTIEYEGRGDTSYTKSTTAPTNAGNYMASITVATNKTATADFTISPIALTIDTVTVTSRAYDKDSTAVAISAVTFKDSSEQAVALTLGEDKDYTVTGAMTDANAGDGKTVNVSVTLKNANYSLATKTTTTTVNISKAAAQNIADVTDSQVYTATSISKSVAGKMPEDAGTLTYMAGTASKTGNVTVPNFAVNATSGIVTATLSGGTANDTVTLPVTISSTNYANSTVNIKITLTAKGDAGVSITGAPESAMTYGDADFILTGKVTNAGTETGDWTWSASDPAVFQITPNGATATVKILKAGSAAITASYESDTTVDTETTAAITVNTKTLTIAAKNQSIFVGGTVPTLSGEDFYTVTGLVGEETLRTYPTLAYQKNSIAVTPDNTTAGTYDIVPSGAAASANYNISYTDGTLTISNKGTQTISAENVTVTYGETGKSVSATVTDPATGSGAISYAVKSGDAVTVDENTGALTIVKAGSAVITVTAAETDTYAQSTRDVAVTVNTKAMTVNAADVTVIVDGQPHGITVNVTDPATGYTVKYGTEEGSYTLDASPTQTEVGTKTVYYQVTADNCTTYTGSAKVTVNTRQTQNITAENVTAVYGDTDKKVTATTNGNGAISYAVKDGSGDYISVDAITGALTIKKVGVAIVVVTAAETAAYAQTTREVTVTINEADAVPATVTANNRAYDGTKKDLVTVDESRLVGGTMWYAIGENATTTPADSLYTTSIPTATDAGTYYVWYKAAGKDNYADSLPSCVICRINEKGTFTVRFDANGGTGTMEPQTFSEGEQFVFPTCTFIAPAGKMFAHWKAGDRSYPENDTITVKSDLTAVAVWTDEKEIKGTRQETLKEVPAELKSLYDTVQQIETALLEKLMINGQTPVRGQTLFIDVELMISRDGGKTWVKATAEDFREGGITVEVDYPEGTNGREYLFAVAHMLTIDMNGRKAGEIEIPEVETTEKGLRFTLNGLSPVAISWQKLDDVAGASLPNTGDGSNPIRYMAMLLIALAGIGMVVRKRK